MESAPTRYRWRTALAGVVALAGLGAVAIAGRGTLSQSASSLAHVRWPWVAVAYAGNAISVSLPLAGPGIGTAFSFRQYERHGIDGATAAWALAVSGIISSLAFAFVLGAGALLSGGSALAIAGVVGAVVSLVPVIVVVTALRFPFVKRRLCGWLARLIRLSRRVINRPGVGAEEALRRFLDHLAGTRLPRFDYAEVFAMSVWNWLADALCLSGALKATGSPIDLADVLLAYGLAMSVGSIGLTPGGLGVIEAALAAALIAVGARGSHALAGVLVYRLVSFWAVMGAGWATMAALVRLQRPAAIPAVAPADAAG